MPPSGIATVRKRPAPFRKHSEVEESGQASSWTRRSAPCRAPSRTGRRRTSQPTDPPFEGARSGSRSTLIPGHSHHDEPQRPTPGREQMGALTSRTWDHPTRSAEFAAHGHANVLGLGGKPILFGTYGARLGVVQRPQADRADRELRGPHLLYCISGRMGVRMTDGDRGRDRTWRRRLDRPGHDAWVIGEEPCTAVDFGGYSQYAKG